MSELEIIAVYTTALGAGWLIGAIGVGGVLLVPALVLIGGMEVGAATPVATLSFLFLFPPANGGEVASPGVLRPGALGAIGAAVGFGSALTGTGGPVLLIPVMMLAGAPAITAVAAGQPIQIVLFDDFVGREYGDATPETLDAIVTMASAEGILLDPVYSGKVFAGLRAHRTKGLIAEGATVVMLHSGGTPALFAYHREIAEFLGVVE